MIDRPAPSTGHDVPAPAAGGSASSRGIGQMAGTAGAAKALVGASEQKIRFLWSIKRIGFFVGGERLRTRMVREKISGNFKETHAGPGISSKTPSTRTRPP